MTHVCIIDAASLRPCDGRSMEREREKRERTPHYHQRVHVCVCYCLGKGRERERKGRRIVEWRKRSSTQWSVGGRERERATSRQFSRRKPFLWNRRKEGSKEARKVGTGPTETRNAVTAAARTTTTATSATCGATAAAADTATASTGPRGSRRRRRRASTAAGQ